MILRYINYELPNVSKAAEVSLWMRYQCNMEDSFQVGLGQTVENFKNNEKNK